MTRESQAPCPAPLSCEGDDLWAEVFFYRRRTTKASGLWPGTVLSRHCNTSGSSAAFPAPLVCLCFTGPSHGVRGCKQPPAPDLLTTAPLTPQVQTSSFAGSQTAQGAGVRSSCSWFLWKSSSSILQVLQPPFQALQSRKTAAAITRNPSLPHKGGCSVSALGFHQLQTQDDPIISKDTEPRRQDKQREGRHC